MTDANFDLLQALRKLWAYSPLQWSFRHVKGHQDDNLSVACLDRWAKLNIEMDEKAKKHMSIAQRLPRHYHIAEEPWSVWTNGRKIITDWTNTLYDIAHST